MEQPDTNRQQNTSVEKITGYVAGVDIGGTNLRVALADMTGRVIAKSLSSTVGVRGPEAVIAVIKDSVQQLIEKTPPPHGSLQAIAAGAPGVTDVDAGIVIATSYLMGWRDVPLGPMLEDVFKVPVIVDNDVNLAAVGEHWQGVAKGINDFVFIGIGTGVGASIVLNGVPFRGTYWAAGEIGYMLLPETNGFEAKDGEPGALEELIGGEGIKVKWRRIWCDNKTALPQALSATQIFDHALSGDALAQSVLEQTARTLSHAIYNINLVLNCPLFVLGGGVGVHPALRNATEGNLARIQLRGRPQLAISSLGVDAQVMGAVCQALAAAAKRVSPSV